MSKYDVDPEKANSFMLAVRALECEHGLYIDGGAYGLDITNEKPGHYYGIFCATNNVEEMKRLDALPAQDVHLTLFFGNNGWWDRIRFAFGVLLGRYVSFTHTNCKVSFNPTLSDKV